MLKYLIKEFFTKSISEYVSKTTFRNTLVMAGRSTATCEVLNLGVLV